MRFATDRSLGKLGRKLRAAGFDTLCQHQCGQHRFFDTIETDRIILTRTRAVQRRFRKRRLIFIKDNDASHQMRQVIRTLAVSSRHLNCFSRCLECNSAVSPVDRASIKGRVPGYVWQHHRLFHVCRSCQRIYWAGSHQQRMRRQFEILFEHKED